MKPEEVEYQDVARYAQGSRYLTVNLVSVLHDEEGLGTEELLVDPNEWKQSGTRTS